MRASFACWIAVGLCSVVAGGARAQIDMIKTAPFEAVRTISHAGSEHFTVSCKVARRSNGSTYQEMPDSRTGSTAYIMIQDAPGKRSILLDIRRKSYSITELSISSIPEARSPEQLQRLIERIKTQEPIHGLQDGVNVTTTSLGLRTRDGFIENGQRRVMERPPASSLLKEQIWETWWIPALNVQVEQSGFDADNKVAQTTKLTDIRRTEPDPRLFEIPPDYVPSPPPPSR
jgi:hypothetical protein